MLNVMNQNDPTEAQAVAIVKLCLMLGIEEKLENTVHTFEEASALIKDLCAQVRANRYLYSGEKYGLGRR